MNQQNETPSALLRAILKRRIDQNPNYSMRAFARDLKMSHSYLSQILNNLRPLTLRQASRIERLIENNFDGENLGFSRLTDQVAKFYKSRDYQLEMERGTPSFSDKEAKQKALELVIDLDRFRFVSEWYHGAILELVSTKDFTPNYRWVARRLNITEIQVKEAVSRLKRLGVLKVEKKKWRKVSQHIFFPTQQVDLAVRTFHAQMLGKASEALQFSGDKGYQSRDMTGFTAAVDPARLPEAKRRIAAFRKKLMRFLERGNSTEVYQLNVHLFPLTRESASLRSVKK